MEPCLLKENDQKVKIKIKPGDHDYIYITDFFEALKTYMRKVSYCVKRFANEIFLMIFQQRNNKKNMSIVDTYRYIGMT